MLKRCNFIIKAASKWYQIRCAKKKYKVQRNKAKIKKLSNSKCFAKVLPICTKSRAKSLACSLLLIWTKIITSKALVSTLSNQYEVQNSNYSLGFKAKIATKPAPKNKTTRKLYQAMGLAHYSQMNRFKTLNRWGKG